MNRTDPDKGQEENPNGRVHPGNNTFLVFFSLPLEEHVKRKISTELVPSGKTEFAEFASQENPGNAEDLKRSSESSRMVAIADRQISCNLIQAQAQKSVFDSIILINPEFRSEVAGLLYLLEIPVLIISSAEANWTIRSQAISYHDLIASSEMVNVRSSAMNPVLELKPQVFNAIIKFVENAF